MLGWFTGKKKQTEVDKNVKKEETKEDNSEG
jgi:hypothetical protein